MGSDLKLANLKYKKLLEEARTKEGFRKYISKEAETLLYMFYLAGFSDGSNMVAEEIEA